MEAGPSKERDKAQVSDGLQSIGVGSGLRGVKCKHRR